MPSLWLVDGSHTIFRAYHALPHLSTRQGVPTNAVYGFTTMLLRAIREGNPTHLAVAFDEEAKAKRSEVYSAYKATRGAPPEDLTPQFPLVRRVLEALRVPAIGFPGYEADDVIATLARRARAQGWEVVIVSGDKDLMQLVVDGIRCYDSMYEKWYGPAEVEEKWGVPPQQVADLLALTGDKIDNIPGVPGVGEKTAAGLLKEYGTLENVLANAAGVKKPKLRENLLASLDAVRRARQLISLYEELPLPVQLEDLERKPVDEPQARKLFTELEFVRLVNDLPRPPPTPPSGARSMATTLEHVQRLVDKARAANRFALLTLTSEDEPLRDDLLGLAVSLPDESVYVPLGHRAGVSGALFAPAELNAVKAIALLKPLLEDPNIIKDGHDLKRDVDAWRRAGVSFRGLGIDSRLASYLIDPTGRDHSLVQTARERISCELPLLKELCERTGKGRKATPLAEVPVDETSAAACALVEGARRLCEALGEDLRADQELLGLYADIEKPLIEVLADLELTGIRIDVPRLQKLSDELGRQIDALLHEIYQLAGGEFLPGSTQQLAEVLYKKLNLPVLKRGKTGPSTDQEVLEELAQQHPLPAKVLEHRQLTKLKNTYLDALPAVIGRDGRLHTTFDQAVAATGRLSSVNPNLQNIPIRTAIGAKIREAFIPEPGWKLLSADYSQIELRVLAHVSGDPMLRASFESGEDLHARTAGETFGVPPSDVTRRQRDIAKMINYGIAYGLSAFGLAHRLGLEKSEAGDIIERYFARYAKVKQWLDDTIAQARSTGVVKTMFGRRRYLPDINSRNPAARSAAERTAVNTPIQGTAADLVKRAMLKVDAALRGKHQARMLLQVHDELVLEAPPAEVAEVGRIVKEQMSAAADLAVPLVVELGSGDTWATAH
ncbi:MAG: DNA polymerase I [Deltaproteobacteria bacterium]|nr:MAG: DNA polymerase I [Deltaproteobacteria bacterium]TMB25044.1 MAG: DNA polymerase I [Deltaproteobacteria bacterium]